MKTFDQLGQVQVKVSSQVLVKVSSMNSTNITLTSALASGLNNLSSTLGPLVTTAFDTIACNTNNFTANSTRSTVSVPQNPPEFQLWFKIGLVIIGVLIIFGNGIVVYFIVTRPRLHTKTNVMVISLAVSDIVVGLGIVPSFLACMYVTSCDNLLSKLFYDAFLLVSVCNLCCITFDRFLAVTRPLRYHMKITPKAVIIMIALSWIVPSIVSLVPVTWLYTNTNAEAQKMNNKIFYALQVIVFMFLPCLMMLIVYAVIYSIAYKQKKNIQHVIRSVSSVGNLSTARSMSASSPGEARATLKVFGKFPILVIKMISLRFLFVDVLALPSPNNDLAYCRCFHLLVYSSLWITPLYGCYLLACLCVLFA